jgi:hypothetical protein
VKKIKMENGKRGEESRRKDGSLKAIVKASKEAS